MFTGGLTTTVLPFPWLVPRASAQTWRWALPCSRPWLIFSSSDSTLSVRDDSASSFPLTHNIFISPKQTKKKGKKKKKIKPARLSYLSLINRITILYLFSHAPSQCLHTNSRNFVRLRAVLCLLCAGRRRRGYHGLLRRKILTPPRLDSLLAAERTLLSSLSLSPLLSIYRRGSRHCARVDSASGDAGEFTTWWLVRLR